MFERKKVGEDILFEMEDNLRKNAFIEETAKTSQRIEAMELLTKAASNFEQTGHIKEAEAVTRIVEFVANKKPESAKKQVENMKETGTQWPKESFAVIDGNPEDEEDKLYEEYMNNPEIAAAVRVGDDEDSLSKHEMAAIAKLWE